MINIAELLKNAPKGMKLYSPLFGEVEFAEVMDTDYVPIRVMKRSYGLRFDKYGRYMGNEYPDSECLLFPSKEVRTWEGWKLSVEPKFKVGDWIINRFRDICLITDIDLENGYYTCESNRFGNTDGDIYLTDKAFHLWTIADAKDGDVLVTTTIRICPFIYRKTSYKNNLAYYYAGIDGNGDFCEGCLKRTSFHFGPVTDVVPATKKQRDLLFKKMEEAGYKWDADKKELRKIKHHYDIKNFKPFDKVLVRDSNGLKWTADLFSYIDDGFVCTGGIPCRQCIPFNDKTKHLLGTTDMCDEEFINW